MLLLFWRALLHFLELQLFSFALCLQGLLPSPSSGVTKGGGEGKDQQEGCSLIFHSFKYFFIKSADRCCDLLCCHMEARLPWRPWAVMSAREKGDAQSSVSQSWLSVTTLGCHSDPGWDHCPVEPIALFQFLCGLRQRADRDGWVFLALVSFFGVFLWMFLFGLVCLRAWS